MPIFEYCCTVCQAEFEALVRGAEMPICPSCGSTKLNKQLSVPAAHTSASSKLPNCDIVRDGGCDAPCCGSGGCPM